MLKEKELWIGEGVGFGLGPPGMCLEKKGGKQVSLSKKNVPPPFQKTLARPQGLGSCGFQGHTAEGLHLGPLPAREGFP